MKKFISLFLIISMIMCNLNTRVVDALSSCCNEVKSLVDAVTNDEEKNDAIINDEVKNDNLQVDTKVEKETPQVTTKNDSEKNEVVTSKNTDKQTENFSEKKESVYDSNDNITVIDSKKNRCEFARLDEAMAYIMNSLKSENTVKVVFNKNYNLSDADVESMRCKYNNKRLIFTSDSKATVTIDRDLELYDQYYQPGYDSANIITFENIKLEFTKPTNIYANGTWLHMGKNVEMVGDNYPNLCAASINDISAQSIHSDVKMFIESGRYNKIFMTPEQKGRYIDKEGYIYFFGGHANEIVRFNSSDCGGMMYVELYGGIVDAVKNEKENPYENSINISVVNKVTVGTLEKIFQIEMGTSTYSESEQGHLTINGKAENVGLLILYNKNNTIEIGEDGKLSVMYFLNFGEEPTISLPANRDKDNVPLTIYYFFMGTTKFNVKLSTLKGAKPDFYAMKFYYGGKIDKDTFIEKNFIVDKINQNFYFNKIETDSNMCCLKLRMKEKGPLIFDTSLNRFYYMDSNGKKQDADWINNKNLDFKNEVLTYDDLAKDSNGYYRLVSDEITLKIIGNGSDGAFKFNNNWNSKRSINIEFENIDVSDYEFLLQNIKSMNITGKNKIEMTSGSTGKTALSYSFAGGNTNHINIGKDAYFMVLNNYNNREDNINNNIVCNNNSYDKSILNLYFEEPISKGKDLVLDPIEKNSSTQKRFYIETGYDVASILLEGDNKEYRLKDVNSEVPYYYRTSNSIDDSSKKILGEIKTKITLSNSKQNYYKLNNKQRVAVFVTQNSNKFYYLLNTLKEAMDTYVDHTGGTHEVVFLGNYHLNSLDDAESIKNHSKNTNKITFKTKVDDYTYLLNINQDIELMPNNNRTFNVNFDDIKFNYTEDNKWIYGCARNVTFGEHVEMEGTKYPSVSLGKNSSSVNNDLNNSSLIINSGTYKCVTGNTKGTLQKSNVIINKGIFNGEVSAVSGGRVNNATLTIKGGAFNSKVLGSDTGSTVSGNLKIIIDNGTFHKEVNIINESTVTNATLTIKDGTFNSRVLGSCTGSNVLGNLNISINKGTFLDEVSAVKDGTVNNTTFTITGGIFNSKVLGSCAGSTILGDLNININEGIFHDEVSAVNGGTVDNITFIIKDGTFDSKVLGLCTESNVSGDFNMRIDDGTFGNQVQVASSGVIGGNINFDILGGRFNNDVIGSMIDDTNLIMTVSEGTFLGNVLGHGNTNTNDSIKANIVMNINGGIFRGDLIGDENSSKGEVIINISESITIPTISNYDKLVVGGISNSVELTISNQLQGNGIKDDELIINSGSNVRLTGDKGNQVGKLTVNGSGNTLSLNVNDTNTPLTVRSTYNNSEKLNLILLGNKSNDRKLVDFLANKVDIDKFNFIDTDYYIKKIDSGNGSKINLYSKISPDKLIFKLDLSESTLTYSINNENKFENVWWCNHNLASQEISFTKANLLDFDNIMPFKDIRTIPNKVFEITGLGSDKTISLDLGPESNFEFKLDNCTLENSRLEVKNLKALRLSGNNSISGKTSDNRAVFSYSFSNDKTEDNVIFDGGNSYLEVSTQNKNIEPFNAPKGNRIDLKFAQPFNENDNTVRLSNNNGALYKLEIPKGTQRLGILVKDSGSYNLYYGESDKTGSSVYVSGNSPDNFGEIFTTSSNNGTVYEYVRRAKPVNIIRLDIPKEQINFSVDMIQYPGQKDITQVNQEQCFNATNVQIENNSTVAKDVFTYGGKTQYFGEKDTDLQLESITVSPSENSNNQINLVSKDQLYTSTNNMLGAKIALKFSSDSVDIAPIDENIGTIKPLRPFIIPSRSTKILELVPDFDDNKHFFNVNMNSVGLLNSSHECSFRFGVKNN